MATQKRNARVPQCMKITSSKDHRYNTADPSTDLKEGASLIKYKPALLNKAKINYKKRQRASIKI